MRILFSRIVLALVFGAAVGMIYVSRAAAQPLYEAKSESVRIVLYDEPCALAEITNLKLRAVWTEGGKDFEGCWAANADLGVLVTYFSDKTAAAIPISAFRRVVGI